MAASEKVFVAQPIAAAAGRIIASPFQFYTTGEDHLRLSAASSYAGVVVGLNGRTIDSKGVIGASAWTFTPTSDRTVTSTDIPLQPGAVLNLTCFARSGTPQIGQVFVIVQLIRGLGAGAIVLGTLLQGYITSKQHLAWPGSPIQASTDGDGWIVQVVPNVFPPGVNAIIQTPTGAQWEVLAATVTYTTGAFVGTRSMLLKIGGDTVVQGYGASPTTIPASTTWTWAFQQGVPVFEYTTAALSVAPLVGKVVMRDGNQATFVLLGGVAPDSYTNTGLTVRERLEVV